MKNYILGDQLILDNDQFSLSAGNTFFPELYPSHLLSKLKLSSYQPHHTKDYTTDDQCTHVRGKPRVKQTARALDRHAFRRNLWKERNKIQGMHELTNLRQAATPHFPDGVYQHCESLHTSDTRTSSMQLNAPCDQLVLYTQSTTTFTFHFSEVDPGMFHRDT